MSAHRTTPAPQHVSILPSSPAGKSQKETGHGCPTNGNGDVGQSPTLTPRALESTAGSLVDIDVAVLRKHLHTKTGISGTEELIYASTVLSAMTASRAVGVIALVYVRFDGTGINVQRGCFTLPECTRNGQAGPYPAMAH